MKVIAMINQKGGVAKTTTVASLAWGLSKQKKKVLVIDFDPQGNLSSSMGATAGSLTAYEWLGCNPDKQALFKDCVQHLNGVDLIPADLQLAQAEMYISQKLNREQYLKKAINKIPNKEEYDYIIIDSPPALGMLTINIMCATDEIIIPLKPEWLCFEKSVTLVDTIRSVQMEVNPNLKVSGFLLTMCDSRRNINDITELIKQLAENIKSKLFETKIRVAVAMADAPSYQKSIYAYMPNSNASKDYEEFTKEFLKEQENAN